MKKKKNHRLFWIMGILILLALLGFCTGGNKGNVALIEINGIITSSRSSSLIGGVGPSSPQITSLIQKAQDDPEIEAIILRINSPGGTPVGSEEIVRQIKSVEKPVVSYIVDMGASGAYWVAAATDKVFASPISIVGSVGVNAAYLEFSGLMEDYNVTYVPLAVGEYKDMGTPFKELEVDEQERMINKLQLMHDYFLDDVVQLRGLNEQQKEEISKSDFYVGIQGKELNLIDEFGGQREATIYVKEKYGIEPRIIKYQTEGFFSIFSGLKLDNSIKNQLQNGGQITLTK